MNTIKMAISPIILNSEPLLISIGFLIILWQFFLKFILEYLMIIFETQYFNKILAFLYLIEQTDMLSDH